MFVTPLMKGIIWPVVKGSDCPFVKGEILSALVKQKTDDFIVVLVKGMTIELPRAKEFPANLNDRFLLEFAQHDQGKLVFRVVEDNPEPNWPRLEDLSYPAMALPTKSMSEVKNVLRGLILARLPLRPELVKEILAVLPKMDDGEGYFSRLERALMLAKIDHPVQEGTIRLVDQGEIMNTLRHDLPKVPTEISEALALHVQAPNAPEKIEQLLKTPVEQQIMHLISKYDAEENVSGSVKKKEVTSDQLSPVLSRVIKAFSRQTLTNLAIERLALEKSFVLAIPIVFHENIYVANMRITRENDQQSNNSAQNESTYSVDIEVDTENLGLVEVGLLLQGEALSCRIGLPNEADRLSISKHLPDLLTMLEDVGWRHVEVKIEDKLEMDRKEITLIPNFAEQVRGVALHSIDTRM